MSETSPRRICVRELAPGDFDAWSKLFDGYIEFYNGNVSETTIAATWRRLIERLDGMVGFIALERDTRPVGIANVVFHRSTWSPTVYCYLEDLYVDPSARGEGAGRALIEAVYAEADRRQATRTYWVTATDNAVARRLYDRVAERAPFVQYRR